MPSESSTVRSLKSTLAGRAGRGADGDHDLLCRHLAAAAVRARDDHRVVVREVAGAGEDAHVVSRELVADDVGLALDDGLRARRRDPRS